MGGLIEVVGEIVQAYENLKNGKDGQALRLSGGVKTTSSEKRRFVWTDALDEQAADHRVKLLSLLNRIL